MTKLLDASTAARRRAEQIDRGLARHRLVFVQMGVAFDPVRDAILEGVTAKNLTAKEFCDGVDRSPDFRRVLITDLEGLASEGSSTLSLGALREEAMTRLDAVQEICLVSRSPRQSFAAVAGSSLLEDAALCMLPLLERDELTLSEGEYPPAGWPLPLVAAGQELGEETFSHILAELGTGVLAALDHALFEVDPRGSDGLRFMSSREKEALRGAGILELTEAGDVGLAHPHAAKVLRESLSRIISEHAEPPPSLAAVVDGLWSIERTLRSRVRSEAIARWNDSWRAQALGGLDKEALKRAQLDSTTSAKAVTELRDPLEWLTLGELLDVIRSDKFGGLGVDAVIWRKLHEQLVPVRNRLAHVRLLKADDEEKVIMWSSIIRRQLR